MTCPRSSEVTGVSLLIQVSDSQTHCTGRVWGRDKRPTWMARRELGDKTSEVGRARPPRTSTETLNERTSPAYRRTLWDHVGTDEREERTDRGKGRYCVVAAGQDGAVGTGAGTGIESGGQERWGVRN